MSEETHKRIGDYQILDELGSGGMGRVYRVRNVISDRIEAMKVLLPDLAGRQELAARFLREIKVMASLDHPHIAALRTAFTADNQLIMVMEYVEGTTLAARLEQSPIPVPDALNYIDQTLSALSYAHQRDIIHRDIKPGNIMLTPQGIVKVMDFGIACASDQHNLTMTGTTLGSLGYMSPEQVKGEATDARSDLYSVGVSLYEMVTGQRPFQAHSDYSIMAAHVREIPKPPIELQPGLPAALNEIIVMAMAKDPARRFQTADAFRNALSSVRASLPAVPVAGKIDSQAVTANSVTSMPAVAANPQSQAVAAGTAAENKGVTAPNPPTIPMPPPAPSSGHRGLYMTLGALIVLAVLAVAGIYMPRHGKAVHSDSGSAPAAPPAAIPQTQVSDAQAPQAQAPQGSAQPTTSLSSMPLSAASASSTAATSDAVQSSAPPAGIAPAAGKSSAMPDSSTTNKATVAHSHRLAAKNGGTAQGEAASAPGANAAASPPATSAEAANGATEMDELEHQVDQLSNRAAAVNSSLDRLQQQQASSGYGLRGDMAARQASMKNNLSRAQEAVERGDTARAKKYTDQAQSDLEALEHFLGH
jgi:eukaryotic-like serine/threonine-protein kinase